MIIIAGRTNVSVYFSIVQDVSGTSPGEPKTGLLFSDIETGGSASYMRQGAARVDLTLITLASASAAHSDGGFILVDDTNMPGLYRCDVPDAAFATGVDQVVIQLVAASGQNALVAPLLIDIVDEIISDGVSFKGADIDNIFTTVGKIPLLDGTISWNATALAAIRDEILPTQNAAFNNIEFLFVAASDHVTPVTSASGTAVTRSIDGGAFGSGTGTLAEVGNGIYQYDASAADMNGGVITFRFTGSGGTPGAPDDAFLTIVTGGGV